MSLLSLIFTFFSIFFSAKAEDLNSKFNSSQLIVVKTDNWNKIEGEMSVYEFKNNKWNLILSDIPIVTGRTGMAWARGLHDSKLNTGTLKKEGDGKSPAGVFHLSGLFGYNNIQSKMNSMKVNERTFCVDDSKSAYYNRIVNTDTLKKDWNSAETMLMKSDAYKFGIFVDYNVDPPVPQDGSCIFIHIWSGSNSPTAGCIAMKETDILKLINFLDKSKNPILVQAPKAEYEKMKAIYILP